jgi:hypothetical protein
MALRFRRSQANPAVSDSRIEFRFALELFPQFLLRVADFCRHYNPRDNEDVAMSSIATRQTATTRAELRTALGSSGDLMFTRAAEV